MKFKCPLIVVEDMDRSRQFYEEVLGQNLIADLMGKIFYTGEFALQTRESWVKIKGLGVRPPVFRNNAVELYFETTDFDGFLERLQGWGHIERLHEVIVELGQRVIRFYDPDGHLIEVGENMQMVVKRMLDRGLSIVEIAEATGYPVDFVLDFLRETK